MTQPPSEATARTTASKKALSAVTISSGASDSGQRGRPDDVHEQGADLALLPAQPDVALERLAGHRLADIAAEEVLQLLALPQPVNHPVEARLEQADLAAVVDGDLDREVSGLDPLDGVANLLDRIGDRTGRDGEDDQAGEQADHRPGR